VRVPRHRTGRSAERASRAKDERLDMLGHALGNPLGALVKAARVLGTPGLPEDVDRRAQDVIARQSSHLAKLVDDLVDAGSGSEEAPATTPARALHILVVEDHDDSREMLRHFLEGAGHRVSEAADGSTAAAEALRLRPDVAVIDVGLPGLDGFEVAKRIRAAQLAPIRLIALSGHGLPQDRSRASEAGFDEHLVKPITPERLMGALLPTTPESRSEHR